MEESIKSSKTAEKKSLVKSAKTADKKSFVKSSKNNDKQSSGFSKISKKKLPTTGKYSLKGRKNIDKKSFKPSNIGDEESSKMIKEDSSVLSVDSFGNNLEPSSRDEETFGVKDGMEAIIAIDTDSETETNDQSEEVFKIYEGLISGPTLDPLGSAGSVGSTPNPSRGFDNYNGNESIEIFDQETSFFNDTLTDDLEIGGDVNNTFEKSDNHAENPRIFASTYNASNNGTHKNSQEIVNNIVIPEHQKGHKPTVVKRKRKVVNPTENFTDATRYNKNLLISSSGTSITHSFTLSLTLNL